MFKNEIIIPANEKKELLNYIKQINAILDKYPYPSYAVNTVPVIARAKSACHEAETWINYLYTNNKEI